MRDVKRISSLNTQIDINIELTKDEYDLLLMYKDVYFINDRWTLEYSDGVLYFYRYMAGECIFEVDLISNKISHFRACRDRNIYDYDNDEIDILYVKELIEDALEASESIDW